MNEVKATRSHSAVPPHTGSASAHPLPALVAHARGDLTDWGELAADLCSLGGTRN